MNINEDDLARSTVPELTTQQRTLRGKHRVRMRLWVSELRARAAEQGLGRLAYREGVKGSKSKMRYCCLGIGCEVAMANGLELRRHEIPDNGLDLVIVEYDGHRDHLPPEVAEWFGLGRNPAICYVDPAGCEVWADAAEFNDGDVPNLERLNFLEIADAFERTYLENDTDEIPD